MIHRAWFAMAAGFLSCLSPHAASAADYPARPIRVVVPFAAGGSSDITARAVADKLADALKQPVVVENHTGASGVVGVAYAARATPDGYTLLSATPGSYGAAFVKDLPFDVLKDFEFITTVYRGALIVVVNPSLQVKTLKELVDYARANPGKVSYGFPGLSGRLSMEVLKISTGTNMVAIPYKSSAQIMNGVLSGDTPLAVDSPVVYRPYLDSGKLVALAVADTQRLSALPNIPTTTEAGFPQLQSYFHSGFVAPAGTPAPIIDTLNKAIVAIVAMPDIQERFKRSAYEPMTTTPAQMREVIAQELDYYTRAARQSHYVPE